MKHRPRAEEQDDLLRPRLVDMIDPRHELVRLAALIDWEVFEREWSGFFPSGKGRPATEPRLVAGLLYLQHAYRLSDEAVVARWVPVIRRGDLGGMDDLKALMFISFLLSDRWANNHRGEPDGKTAFLGLAGCIAEADKMRTTRFDAGHDLRDGGVAVFGQPVDAGADQEIRSQLTGKAEEFIDVALAVADMDAWLRRADQLGREAQIVQPAHAFLLLDRHSRRIDLSRQRLRTLELFSGPEFRCGEPERQTFGCHGEAGMREHATDHVLAMPTLLALPAARGLCESDLLPRGPLERNLVVSCSTRIGPSVACTRNPEAAK